MNNRMQDTEELQDEELYALLDKAMETDRLCVSEDLIQKTLKRVAEEGGSKVVSFETVKKRRSSPVKYAGAAAAVLVLALGVRAVSLGSLNAKDNMQMAARNDMTERKNESYGKSGMCAEVPMTENSVLLDGDANYGVSDSTSDFIADVAEESETMKPTAESRGGEYAMNGVSLVVSDRLSEALRGAGWALNAGEYWEFADREELWEEELMRVLMAGECFEEGFPEKGTYRYVLDRKNGDFCTVRSKEPLDAIVRLETEKGVIWGLIGNRSLFYAE